ncbi:GTPase ObgE [Blattabacterium cuenoti]|uniref:GTPase ObgE n=1 Tax=Blattabacterium cuenoti TaxID=1653831 RepID=UPI00163C6C2A|nr:GTPase ObgE [Blattabacterium cuenoti]
MKNNFVDSIKIFCKSGDGGSGMICFRKGKYIFKSYPDGGSGGNGGNIFIQGNSNICTFIHLRYKKHWIANPGKSGGKNNRTGSNGKNILIEVPLGTIVRDCNGNLIMEVNKNMEKKMLLSGGIGGKGNASFGNKKNKILNFNSKNGVKTKGKWINLELKVLADVGIIGFPNVGKSTLLATITKAKTKVGNYPFTNKIPYVGILNFNFKSIVIADIPGIIENASHGKGLGHNFLRHIERNYILLFLIFSEEKNEKKQYLILLNELKKFNPELLKKKRLLVASKSDIIKDCDKKRILNEFLNIKENITFISYKNKNEINNLLKKIFNILINKKTIFS